ncbi:RNA ligase [Priestia flexa]|uniref:RNA ligase n=2 Tax=Priestia flexa TaxID=86664 RepID=UPI000C246E0E|nr:RNA ligase [Priestia flexa]MEC0667406.1 RNA ligase [Priestia flexa]
MASWNPVLQLVTEIKRKYVASFGLDTYDFKTWIAKLGKQEYHDIFDCLHINQKDEFMLIRYDLTEVQQQMWEDPNSIYRECRSVVIDVKREELVLTPFRKFFNLNEVEENQLERIAEKFRSAQTVEVANKLDGSMQNARWYDGQLFVAGSMALDARDSWRLAEGYAMLTESYVRMIQSRPDLTFIFEYISKKDAHVVVYEEKNEGMHLIGARSVETGEHLPYYKLIDLASAYEIKVVDLERKKLEQLLVDMKQMKSNEKEGWVINVDAHYVKVKCDDYVNIHRLLDRVSSVNVIIEAIANETFDDLVSKVPDSYKERVNNVANLIFTYLKKMKEQINEWYAKAPKKTQKEFMIWVEQNVPQHIKPYVRSEYLGVEYNLLKKGKLGYKKMSELGYREFVSETKEGE